MEPISYFQIQLYTTRRPLPFSDKLKTLPPTLQAAVQASLDRGDFSIHRHYLNVTSVQIEKASG